MEKNNSNTLRFPEVRVVEASAGSGKTYELAKRFLQLLMNPNLKETQIPLRNILAITFTLKATREMRERIIELLKKIALDSFESNQEKNDLLSFIGLDEKKANKKAFNILDYIINHYNFFQVRNIDKFINVILSSCASELKLSANFKIKENYSDYISFALDDCINQAVKQDKLKNIFENFLEQYLYLENKKSWFPKNDILEILTDMFSKNNIYGGVFEKNEIKNNQIIKLKKRILGILQEIYNYNFEGLNRNFTNRSLKNFLQKNTDIFNVADLDKKYFIQNDLPMNKNHKAPKKLENLWKEFKSLISVLCEQEALSLLNCYIDIFEKVYEIFREYSETDDVVFMEELSKKSKIIFEEVGLGVPELYYRLSSRFKHYLIDEFQDTNRIQWDSLFMMVEDALSSGGSLFYVGDKKQAIYRFRGGDVELFDDLKKDFASFNVNDKAKLKVNYRSQKQVVEFNNNIFSEENLNRHYPSSRTRSQINYNIRLV